MTHIEQKCCECEKPLPRKRKCLYCGEKHICTVPHCENCGLPIRPSADKPCGNCHQDHHGETYCPSVEPKSWEERTREFFRQFTRDSTCPTPCEACEHDLNAMIEHVSSLVEKARAEERAKKAEYRSSFNDGYKEATKVLREKLLAGVKGMKVALPKGKCLNAENHIFGSCFQCEKTKGYNFALSDVRELITRVFGQ